MLNTYNNIGTLESSNYRIRAVLELFHQINIRIPGLLYTMEELEDVIIDESCLLGNAHGHKYIHKSGKCLKRGLISTYYSEKWGYYVVCCKPIMPTKTFQHLVKGKVELSSKMLFDIGVRYIADLNLAISLTVGRANPADTLTSAAIDHELKAIIDALWWPTTQMVSDGDLSGVRNESKYRAPLLMSLTTLYQTLHERCRDCGIGSKVTIDPIYYWRYRKTKENEDMAYILSYVNERRVLSGINHWDTLYQLRFCWDAIDRNTPLLGVISENDQPDKYYHKTMFEELTQERVIKLVNLMIHLYYHEMGHLYLGLDKENEVDAWAKESRIQVWNLLDFRCPEWRRIITKTFLNYAHYMEECSMDN